jgi:hypothetical protein
MVNPATSCPPQNDATGYANIDYTTKFVYHLDFEPWSTAVEFTSGAKRPAACTP